MDEANANSNAVEELLAQETRKYEAEKSVREATETRAAQLQQILNAQEQKIDKQESTKQQELVKRDKIRQCGISSAFGSSASSLEGIANEYRSLFYCIQSCSSYEVWWFLGVDIKGHLKRVFSARGISIPNEIVMDSLECGGWLIKKGDVRR